MLKNVVFYSLCLAVVSCNNSVSDSPSTSIEATSEEATSLYDHGLAERLRADEYGMGKYVMAFLKRGPKRTEDKDEAAALQAAHMENIGRLVDAGKLVLAGPFLDDGELRGIYIFDVESIEEAKALTETDPAIQAGSLVMELHPWYGSAAVREIGAIHAMISKEEI